MRLLQIVGRAKKACKLPALCCGGDLKGRNEEDEVVLKAAKGYLAADSVPGCESMVRVQSGRRLVVAN